ncbi:hypothetical protein Ciccas_013173 [Cichlidogyrus casuarinus]|uniref:Uncharacterized protein n=1 Tax=Cichlidogyrus casuarinus TaxID=1844966 RepID=A0ABD2PL97_9PLAT
MSVDSTNFGCACPPNRTLDANHDRSICGPKLADLGEFCDNVNAICRSKYALCQPYDKSLSKFVTLSAKKGVTAIQGRCACMQNLVAVFQNNLQYHECCELHICRPVL